VADRDAEVVERIRRGLLYTESEASFQNEPFSSCVVPGLDVVQDEDGLDDRRGAAWRGQQRSFARIFHVLRVAMARSPMARTFAWCLFTAFCRQESFGRFRWRLNGFRTVPWAPW
jgi:hypothetical protein